MLSAILKIEAPQMKGEKSLSCVCEIQSLGVGLVISSFKRITEVSLLGPLTCQSMGSLPDCGARYGFHRVELDFKFQSESGLLFLRCSCI